MLNRETTERFKSLGIEIPKILLPDGGVDLAAWAIIACDQFTSDISYWEAVDSFVGAKPSTLRMILPECFLESPDVTERIDATRKAMGSYLSGGTLRELSEGFILVERETSRPRPRWGLMAALDLERYNYRASSRSLIRATEGTIEARLPPRARIRSEAPLEVPHIMVLYNDAAGTVLSPLIERANTLPLLYNTELMFGSGRVRGYRVNEPEALSALAAAFERLADPEAFRSRFGQDDPLLFAIGDGNHSLAAAKSVWEEVKRQPGANLDDPRRFALAELVNIHDEGLFFEPIHRVIFGGAGELLKHLEAAGGPTLTAAADINEVLALQTDPGGKHTIGVLTGGRNAVLRLPLREGNVAAGALQPRLDTFLADHPASTVDYIHDLQAALRLGADLQNVVFLLPPIQKQDFFHTVIREGAFPRKTFSMGEAREKRFYFESRSLLV